MEKRNKEIYEKYNALKNRIKILKREDQIYKNQLMNIKNKERKDKMIQFDKIKLKYELNKIKEEQNKELLKKKERVHRFKDRERNKMEETRNENLSNKKRKYQSALNDKYIRKCIIEELNSQQLNKKCSQHEKVKQYYNEYETNKIKKNLLKENEQQLRHENNMNNLKQKERKIKKKCTELESIEKKCLENLYKTKEQNMKYIENTTESLSKYKYGFNKFGSMKNLNRSTELDNYYKNNNKIYTVLSPTFRSKISRKDNITEYTNSSSRDIFKNSQKKKNISINTIIKSRNPEYIYNKSAMSQSYVNKKDNDNKINNYEIKKEQKNESSSNMVKKNKNTIKIIKKKKSD